MAARRALASLLFGLAACGPADRSAPVSPRPSSGALALGAGDAIVLTTFDDPELSGRAVLDGDGAIAVPYCGRVALGGVMPSEVAAKVGACLVASGAYSEPPAISVVVERGSVLHVLVGKKRALRDLPFEPGLRLIGALASTIDGRPGVIGLRRGGDLYTIDVSAIATGLRADVELAPGDTVVVLDDVPLRPLVAVPPSTEVALGSHASAPPSATCGELLLAMAALGASPKGGNHHDAIALRDAVRGACADDEAGAASLRDACADARRRQVELSAHEGPRHPEMRRLDAELAVCREAAAE